MKKTFAFILTSLLLLACNEGKIGFVDNSELINQYQKKKDIELKFKNQVEAFQKKADSLSRAFQLEYQKASIDAKKMSRAKQEKLALELQTKGQGLQQQFQREEQAITKASQAEIDTLIKKVKTYIQAYGRRNNYTYILGSNEAGSVLYGDKTKDLTELLLDSLNANYTKTKSGGE